MTEVAGVVIALDVELDSEPGTDMLLQAGSSSKAIAAPAAIGRL